MATIPANVTLQLKSTVKGNFAYKELPGGFVLSSKNSGYRTIYGVIPIDCPDGKLSKVNVTNAIKNLFGENILNNVSIPYYSASTAGEAAAAKAARNALPMEEDSSSSGMEEVDEIIDMLAHGLRVISLAEAGGGSGAAAGGGGGMTEEREDPGAAGYTGYGGRRRIRRKSRKSSKSRKARKNRKSRKSKRSTRRR